MSSFFFSCWPRTDPQVIFEMEWPGSSRNWNSVLDKLNNAAFLDWLTKFSTISYIHSRNTLLVAKIWSAWSVEYIYALTVHCNGLRLWYYFRAPHTSSIFLSVTWTRSFALTIVVRIETTLFTMAIRRKEGPFPITYSPYPSPLPIVCHS